MAGVGWIRTWDHEPSMPAAILSQVKNPSPSFQVCYLQGFSFYEKNRLSTLILVHPVAVTIPLLSLLYPICWMIANYYALAKLVKTIFFC